MGERLACVWLAYSPGDRKVAAANNPPGILRTHWHLPACMGGAQDWTDCNCGRSPSAQVAYDRLCRLADAESERFEAQQAEERAAEQAQVREATRAGQLKWRQMASKRRGVLHG